MVITTVKNTAGWERQKITSQKGALFVMRPMEGQFSSEGNEARKTAGPDHFWSLTLTQFPIAATTTQTSWLQPFQMFHLAVLEDNSQTRVSLGRNRSVSEAGLFPGGSGEKPSPPPLQRLRHSLAHEPFFTFKASCWGSGPSHLTFLWASFQAHTSTSLTSAKQGDSWD